MSNPTRSNTRATFFQRLRAWLIQEDDPHVLSLFRIAYGLFMVYEIGHYIQIGLIRNMFVLPAINFKYEGLGWIVPLPEIGMNILLALLMGCALAIALGVFFRWACRIFALGYAYLFLLDESIYNNHIYLFILFALLLSFTEADRSFSLRRNTPLNFTVPHWQIFILQFQLVIVYFYGGIAKLTYDWLVLKQPIQTLIDQLASTHWLAPLIKNDLGVNLLTYGGFILDFGAPLLLWYKPIRRWALLPFILFHFSNSTIFSDIGIFPYIMIVSLILFYETREIPFLNRLIKNNTWRKPSKSNEIEMPGKISQVSSFQKYVLIIYFVIQLLFPLRGHFFPNELDWTTIGNRFSWRMKVNTKQIEELAFYVFNPANGDRFPVNFHTLVNDMQILNLTMDPRSIAQFGRLLKSMAKEEGIQDPIIRTVIRVKYNGRKAQYFIDPDMDISKVNYCFYEKAEGVFPIMD